MPSPMIPDDVLPRPLVFTRRGWLATVGTAMYGSLASAALAAEKQGAKKAKQADRPETPPPTKPPLEPVDITRLPPGLERLDLFLLIGQSNMKGRGHMPEEPKRDAQIVMM